MLDFLEDFLEGLNEGFKIWCSILLILCTVFIPLIIIINTGNPLWFFLYGILIPVSYAFYYAVLC